MEIDWKAFAAHSYPGCQLAGVRQFNGGISAEMTMLALRWPDGREQKVVVRRPRPEKLARQPQATSDEFRILQAIQRTGVRSPAPLRLDTSCTLLPTPFLLLNYIEGEPDYKPDDIDDFTAQVAAQLARIHQVTATSLDSLTLPRLVDLVTFQLARRPPQPDISPAEARIRDKLDALWPWPCRNTDVLLHGDFWPGNWLWLDGCLTAVIDWEDARLGSPLYDIAVTRLDLLLIFGQEAMDAFTQHSFSQQSLNSNNLAAWDLVSALRPAQAISAWASGWSALGRPDITGTTMRQAHQRFVAQAFAALA